MLKARIITTMWNGSTLVKGNKFENEKICWITSHDCENLQFKRC